MEWERKRERKRERERKEKKEEKLEKQRDVCRLIWWIFCSLQSALLLTHVCQFVQFFQQCSTLSSTLSVFSPFSSFFQFFSFVIYSLPQDVTKKKSRVRCVTKEEVKRKERRKKRLLSQWFEKQKKSEEDWQKKYIGLAREEKEEKENLEEKEGETEEKKDEDSKCDVSFLPLASGSLKRVLFQTHHSLSLHPLFLSLSLFPPRVFLHFFLYEFSGSLYLVLILLIIIVPLDLEDIPIMDPPSLPNILFSLLSLLSGF